MSQKTKFIDRIRVYVKGGSGGQGYPKYGGLGGDGGNVIFTAGESGSLYDFLSKHPQKRFIARPGKNSRRMMLLGDPGENMEVEIPPGVALSLDNGTVVAELNNPGDKFTVAKGGAGGGPMNEFKTSVGEARSITIDLKLLADVGLVGFPNAGKSTFLKAVSRAQPKIADYPFTTLRPQLGMIKYEDERQISVADLPGLIEGAHLNVGMGHYFLKHVERTKLLLVVVDIQGFVLNNDSPFRDAFETTLLLNKELELYKPELLDKPQILLINKMDTPNASYLQEKTVEKLNNISDFIHTIDEDLRPSRFFDFASVLPMSAVAGDNIETVKDAIRQTIDETLLEDAESVSDKLTKHINKSNTEMSDVMLS